jgi:hypothetical protein
VFGSLLRTDHTAVYAVFWKVKSFLDRDMPDKYGFAVGEMRNPDPAAQPLTRRKIQELLKEVTGGYWRTAICTGISPAGIFAIVFSV